MNFLKILSVKNPITLKKIPYLNNIFFMYAVTAPTASQILDLMPL